MPTGSGSCRSTRPRASGWRRLAGPLTWVALAALVVLIAFGPSELRWPLIVWGLATVALFLERASRA